MRGRFWKFVAFQPRCVIGERGRGFAIGLLKLGAKALVLQVGDCCDQVFLEEIGRAFRNLDGKFNIGPGKHVTQVRFCRDDNVWNLGLNCDNAANAVFERREIPFYVNVYIGRARVNHGVTFEDRHVLHLKEFLFDRRLQNAQID